MEAIVTKAFELFTGEGGSAGLTATVLHFLMCVLVVHAWLVKASLVEIARGLIHARRRRLENTLTQDYITKEARTLINRELRQQTLWKLTRLFEHRLQELGVLFAERFNQRASYLSSWRTWLTEQNGQIHFKRTFYKVCLGLFCFSFVVSTSLLVTVLVVIFQGMLAWKAMVITFMLVCFIWMPWIFLTYVPFPFMTRKLVAQLQEFNQQVSDARSVKLQTSGGEQNISASAAGT